jgi:hypothetical protein
MPEPAACYQSAISPHRCTTCGFYSVLVHIPTAHIGYYCPKCCPACREKPGPRVVQATPAAKE